MATQAIRLRPEPIRSAFYEDMQALEFVPLKMVDDVAPFLNPIRIFHLQNLTDVNIFYSFDGIEAHGVVASGSFLLLDVTANKSLDQGEFIAAGTTIYVSPIIDLPTEEYVYLSVFYGATH